MHNLIEFLEETYKTKGDKAAAEGEDVSYSFSELRGEALRIGGFIAETLGSSRGKKNIAVYLPKGVKCLCAMLGVLYSGNAYVPLDCRVPLNRTKAILDVIQPAMVITDEHGRQILAGADMPEAIIEAYDHIPTLYPASPEVLISATLSRTQDTDPAYILFTSGSIGAPKGVAIPHRRVINYINWARDEFSITDAEIIGNQAPFHFTVSVMDIYLSLATGSMLCITPEGLFAKPDKLLQYIEDKKDKKVSLIFWVSSAYHHIAKSGALEKRNLRSLRYAWFVGEPMAPQSLSHWMEHVPQAEFVNLYGSTETDMTLYHRTPGDYRGESAVPLGRPCANVEILLLNEGAAIAGPGETGEICVRGSCLAIGYYRDPINTKERFIQNPLHDDYPDIVYRTGDMGEDRGGQIFFHGRRDHQFKHLGYRIEAGEIEAAAIRYPGIRNACVIYDKARGQIVLFYEAVSGIDEAAHRRALMEDLPVYMTPTRYISLGAMPYNANGKIDRLQLKELYLEGGD